VTWRIPWRRGLGGRTGGPQGHGSDDTIEITTRSYRLDDSERGRWSPLGAGKYRILVSGDCFSAECQVHVRDGEATLENPSYSNIACRGENLSLAKTEFHVIGFYAPDALRTIHVRILKNDQLFYESTPSGYCAGKGFCVYPDPSMR
jgi:hypothetical protein